MPKLKWFFSIFLRSISLRSITLARYVVAGYLSFYDAFRLTKSERRNLTFPMFFRLVQANQLNFLVVKTLTQASRKACKALSKALRRGTKRLTVAQLANLQSNAIQACVASGWLAFDEAKNLTDTQRLNLESKTIQAHIAAEQLTVHEAKDLTWTQRRNLESETIQALLDEGQLTFQQAMQLSFVGRIALEDNETRQLFINGEMPVENFLARPGNNAQTNANVVRLNTGQSTHTESVHEAASASAARLAKRYQQQLNDITIPACIEALHEKVNQLPVEEQPVTGSVVKSAALDTFRRKKALRCIDRLQTNTHVDHTSSVSINQLLALSYLAAIDETVQTADGAVDDALVQVTMALYEIQRQYNFDDQGRDINQTRDDIPACSGGTFNKLIERLVGVHPDCEMRFISMQTATLKLERVSIHAAKAYLKNLAEEKAADGEAGKQAYLAVIASLEADGLEAIWDNIVADIRQGMAEFETFLNQRNDFEAFIKTAEDNFLEEDDWPEVRGYIDSALKQLADGKQPMLSHQSLNSNDLQLIAGKVEQPGTQGTTRARTSAVAESVAQSTVRVGLTC